jgi:hypothetical protein
MSTAHKHVPDVRIVNHGSVVLLHLNTPPARDWALNNIDPDAPRFGRAVVVEPRYVAAIADGMSADGLEVR